MALEIVVTDKMLHVILKGLSDKRPVFHSEADFQHALAWEIQKMYPSAQIRLEYRVPNVSEKIYLDILVELAGERIGIELKYKTQRWTGKVLEEPFELKEQSAHDVARYDFVKDVQRLETFVRMNDKGFAVFLTNSPSYWKTGREGTVDAKFRIHEGVVLSGKMSWLSHASAGTMSGREAPLCVRGRYRLNWQDYATIPQHFRYLLVSVPSKPKVE